MDKKNYNLPKYSHGEEIVNTTSHLLGFFFALAITILFIIFQVQHNLPAIKMYPFYIYSGFMMVMFLNSAIYHSRKLESKSRHICRIIDHSDIYLFVAATYTPICVLAINIAWISTTLIILEWSLAIIGMTLTIISMITNNKVLDIMSYSLYLIIGWALVIFFPAIKAMDFQVFLFILLGGIVYTSGAIFYTFGRKQKWFHSIFHFFVLAADVLQFIGIYFVLISQ
ncbi:MAG: hemolysin III family protein [Bacilli bacterium]|nr:hemolysin III family protein [Bacilli bacterium]